MVALNLEWESSASRPTWPQGRRPAVGPAALPPLGLWVLQTPRIFSNVTSPYEEIAMCGLMLIVNFKLIRIKLN